jgi:hypothetical protein
MVKHHWCAYILFSSLSLFFPQTVSLKSSFSCSCKCRGNSSNAALNPCRASSTNYGFLTREWMVESSRVWLPSTCPYFTFRYYELYGLWLTKSWDQDKNIGHGSAESLFATPTRNQSLG